MSKLHFRDSWPGPMGRIEILFDVPDESPRAVALIAHPHPLLGGSAEHKVPAILARGLRDDGWVALRPNFRGVGGSEGVHDEGMGEVDDLVAVSSGLRSRYADLPLVLIGFSFGGYVQIQVARKLAEAGISIARLVLVAPGVGEVEGGRFYEPGDVPPDTLVVHGEKDERVPLANVLRWAEPQGIPVVVVPGADHFFSRRLPILARPVRAQLAGVAAQWIRERGQPSSIRSQ
jgi:alpha/beta superfamily hydrolase